MTRLVKANFVNTSCHHAEPPEHGIFVIHMHVHADFLYLYLSQLGTMHTCIFSLLLSLLLILACLKEALVSLANPL